MTSILPSVPLIRMAASELPVNPSAALDFGVHLGAEILPNRIENVDSAPLELPVGASSNSADLMASAQAQVDIAKVLNTDTDRAQSRNDLSSPEFVGMDRHDQYAVPEISGRYKQEILSTPWRLLPGYGLNYQTTDGRHTTNDSGDSPVNRESAIRKINGLIQFKSIIPAALMEFRLKHHANADAVATSVVSYESVFDPINEAADSRINHAINAPAFQWVKQLFHLTSNFDGQHTVWIRDYALTEDQISEVISIIKAAADECAFDLERIMVNGHEMWSKQYTDKCDGGAECK